MTETASARPNFRQAIRESFEAELAQAAGFVVTSFGGTATKPLEGLRKGLKRAGAKYLVVKRAIFEQALKGRKLASVVPSLNGQAGVCFVSDDPLKALKLLIAFRRGQEQFKITGGVWEGQGVPPAQWEELARFGSKPEMIGRVAGIVSSPLRRLAVQLQGTLRQLVSVLDQVQNKRGGSDGGSN